LLTNRTGVLNQGAVEGGGGGGGGFEKGIVERGKTPLKMNRNLECKG